jgi:hypothetical protein
MLAEKEMSGVESKLVERKNPNGSMGGIYPCEKPMFNGGYKNIKTIFNKLISFSFRYFEMQAILGVFLFLLSSVIAYPTFTGGCKAGNPLGGPHLKSPTSGVLSALDLQLRIGTKTLTPGKAFTVKPANSLPISIVSTGGKSFRGFQIRISKGTTDTSTWLSAGTDSNIQVSQFCTMIKTGGIRILTFSSTNFVP